MDPEHVDILVPKGREAVYLALEGERGYQNLKWADEASLVRSPAEWFMYIDDYVNEAKHALSREPDTKAIELALHTLRKVAAMAIAAMEQNGVRTRAQEGARPIGFSQ